MVRNDLSCDSALWNGLFEPWAVEWHRGAFALAGRMVDGGRPVYFYAAEIVPVTDGARDWLWLLRESKRTATLLTLPDCDLTERESHTDGK